MNHDWQVLFDIVIIVWLLCINRQLKLIDTAFGAIGLVLTRLYRELFGKDSDEEAE